MPRKRGRFQRDTMHARVEEMKEVPSGGESEILFLLLPTRLQLLILPLTAGWRPAAFRSADNVTAVIAPPIRGRIVDSHVRAAGGVHPRLPHCGIAELLAAYVFAGPFLAQIGRQFAAIRVIKSSRRGGCRLTLPILGDALRHGLLHLRDRSRDVL